MTQMPENGKNKFAAGRDALSEILGPRKIEEQ